MDPLRQFRFSLLILISVIALGAGGYMTIEHWSLFDALYMTVITLSTVGYQEVHQLTPLGKLFTLTLIVAGCGIIAYAVGSMIQLMVEGQLRRLLGRKKLEKRISKLNNHYIICGFGRIGSLICRDFLARPLPFVVVDKNSQAIELLDRAGYFYVHGDATNDETLLAAGVERAKGLITAVTSDTDNVYITLTARGLKPDLFILARAGEEGSEKKLLRAGASKVISPYTMGASRMAQAILRPSVVDFIELATGTESLELQMEEIAVQDRSPLAGQTLIESGIRQRMGIIIVGIKKPDGHMIFNPEPSTRISAGATLITLGQPPSIRQLEKIARGEPGHVA